jgi:hypothetical protein
MKSVLHPWQMLLLILAGWINQQQQNAIVSTAKMNAFLFETAVGVIEMIISMTLTPVKATEIIISATNTMMAAAQIMVSTANISGAPIMGCVPIVRQNYFVDLLRSFSKVLLWLLGQICLMSSKSSFAP